jgi:hypothetical protein
MALFLLLIILVDLLLVTRGEAVARMVRDQLETVGPGLELGDATLSLDGTLHLEGLRFSPGALEIASAPSARVELDVLRGRPRLIRLPRLDAVLDPERIADLERWKPSPSTGEGDPPLICVERGSITIRHPTVIAEGKEIVFEIEDGEIIKRQGAPLRAYLCLRHPLMGEWKLEWTSSSEGFDARLTTDCTDVTPALMALVSDEVKRQAERFRPEGEAAIEVRLQSDPESEDIRFTITVRPCGMAIQYVKFPYRLEDCRGEFEINSEGVLIKHMTGKTDGGHVFLSGRIRGFTYGGSYELDIRADRLEVNERLIEACSTEAKKWIRRFDLQGTIGVSGQLLKAPGRGVRPRERLRFDLLDCKFRYEYFPYPIENVDGTLFFDLPKVRVDRVSGTAQDATVIASGELYTKKDEETVDLCIDARGLAFDQVLRSALTPEAKGVFDRFSPGGKVDVDWCILQEAGEKMRHRFTAHLRDATCRPREVPLPIESMSGVIHGELDRQTRVQWDSIRGMYRESPIRVSGDSVDGKDRSVLNLELRGVDVPVTDELVEALPGPVRRAIERSKLEGGGNVRVEYSNVRSDEGESPRFSAEINLTRSALRLDIPITEIEGNLYLTGSTDSATGELGVLGRYDLSNARIHGKRFTSISGSITYQGDRISLTNILGTAYDGVVRGHLIADLETFDFTAGLHVSGAELRQFRQDTINYRQKEISGRVSIDLPEIKGTFGKLETFTGEGRMTIREGTLWAVPLFFKILSLDVSRWGSSSQFEAGIIKFKLKDRKYVVDSAIFRSEEASLVGDGYVDFDWNLNLVFKVETEPLGDFWLFKPINVLINLFSSSFWGIQVTGTFDEPEVGGKILPGKPK